MAGPFDLTGQDIENTYQRVLQTPDGATFYDGTGSLVTFTATAAAGGSNTDVQFNSASLLSGSSNFSFDYNNNNIILTGSILMSGSSSITGVDYIDFDTQYIAGINEPAWKEGRLFYDSGSGALSFYNWEQDVTLNIGQEQWLRARNQTGVPILNGTVVRLLGAIGDRPTIEPAQASDQTNTLSIVNEIIGMATHDIENGTDGFITTFGLVNGLNTNAFNAGDILWVSQSAGKFTNIAPSPPYDRTFVGIVTRKNPNNGSVFLTPLTPIHFHDISSVSASVYQQGDLWMYRSGSVGQVNAWINTKTLGGKYTISGSLTLTGSLNATGSNTFIGDQTISGGLFVYNTVTNNNSLDTFYRNLIASDGIESVSWGSRQLIGSNGFEAVKWSEYALNDSSRKNSVDWENRQALDSNEVASINWDTKQLLQSDGSTVALNYSTDNLVKIIGDLVPGDPITDNTSSWSLGSPTAAWKDLYVSNGSVTFISGSSQASIKLDSNNNIIFTGASVTLPTSSTVTTAKTASYLNTLNQDLTLSGSLTILNNLTIFGTQSVVYITSSQLDISTNLITVNTSTPTVRFGGIAVRDSGSLATGLTGSLLWDSQNDVWIYSNPSGAAYDGGMLLTGPRNTSGLGNEVGITTNYLSKGNGSHHMTSSQISDDGTTVTIPGKLSVTSGITGSLLGTASWATNTLTAVSASSASTSSYSLTLGASLFQPAAGNLQLRNSNSTSISIITDFAASTSVTATSASFATTASFAQNVFAPSFITYTGGTVTNATTSLANVHSSAGWDNVAAGLHEFEIYVTYNVPITTTGARFSISGSTSFNYLAVDLGYSALAADRGAYMFATFDGGAAAASSLATNNNAAIMQGHINTTSTGQLRLRFSTEISGSGLQVTNVTGYLRRLY